ncbi:alpha-galactosidase A [Colletotrichum cereale]|nr:alpha-galactosidase A [Colletotrichum cereale]
MLTMSGHHTANSPVQPTILSIEVDDDDSFESEYRIRIENQVKYLSLPHLPYNEEWSIANISRDQTTGDLKTSLSNRTLVGVKCQWHHTQVDCLELEKTKQLTAMAFEALPHPTLPIKPPSPATIIAKIARFEWELPRIEQETRAYQLLKGSGLAPRFLAHVHENRRIMGFLLEKLEGRSASIQDLSRCETALGKLHNLRLIHGDVNRHNFLVTKEGVKLLDFECLRENGSPESLETELKSLRAELVDELGRGGGFIFHGKSN